MAEGAPERLRGRRLLGRRPAVGVWIVALLLLAMAEGARAAQIHRAQASFVDLLQALTEAAKEAAGGAAVGALGEGAAQSASAAVAAAAAADVRFHSSGVHLKIPAPSRNLVPEQHGDGRYFNADGSGREVTEVSAGKLNEVTGVCTSLEGAAVDMPSSAESRVVARAWTCPHPREAAPVRHHVPRPKPNTASAKQPAAQHQPPGSAAARELSCGVCHAAVEHGAKSMMARLATVRASLERSKAAPEARQDVSFKRMERIAAHAAARAGLKNAVVEACSGVPPPILKTHRVTQEPYPEGARATMAAASENGLPPTLRQRLRARATQSGATAGGTATGLEVSPASRRLIADSCARLISALAGPAPDKATDVYDAGLNVQTEVKGGPGDSWHHLSAPSPKVVTLLMDDGPEAIAAAVERRDGAGERDPVYGFPAGIDARPDLDHALSILYAASAQHAHWDTDEGVGRRQRREIVRATAAAACDRTHACYAESNAIWSYFAPDETNTPQAGAASIPSRADAAAIFANAASKTIDEEDAEKRRKEEEGEEEEENDDDDEELVESLDSMEIYNRADRILAATLSSTGCVTLMQGWWSFEVCHHKHVRQFHAEAMKVTQNSAAGLRKQKEVVQMVETATIRLGAFDGSATEVAREAAVSSDSHVLEGRPGSSEAKVAARRILAARTPLLGADDYPKGSPHRDVAASPKKKRRRYLLYSYTNGDPCTGTPEGDAVGGRPRSTTVKLACAPENKRVAWVTEPETCVYSVVLQLPELCNMPELKRLV